MWERMEQLLSAAGGVIWHVCVHPHMCANEGGRDMGGEHVCTNTSLHTGNAAHGDGTGLYQQEHSHPEPGKPCLPGSQHFSEPLETPQAVLGTLSTWQALINQSGFGGRLPRCSEGHSCVKRGCGRWEGPDWRKGFGELTADLLGLQEVCAPGHTAGHQTHTAGVQVWPDLEKRSSLVRSVLVLDCPQKVLVWPWCTSHFEQLVGLDTSWGPFQSELFHNVNLHPREHYNVLPQICYARFYLSNLH